MMNNSDTYQILNIQKTNLLGFDFNALQAFFVNLQEKPFRANQVFKWIHKMGITQFEQMTDLSKTLRETLSRTCEIKPPEIAFESLSQDGTFKWLMRLGDGNNIETVFIPEPNRGTLCVSSQVGCMLNCEFCSTAKQGFNRNLTTAEIIGQVFQARNRLNSEEVKNLTTAMPDFSNRITNVVMMGMGEPLLNCEALFPALSMMRSDLGYDLPRRRVTVSTAGVVPNIDRLSQETDVALALSLHAPNDQLRSQIVPLNKKYPIETVLDACRRYVGEDKNRHVTMEYVMLKDVNDGEGQAKQLAKLLQGISCKINLIPFNPFPNTQFERSTAESILKFQKILQRAGYITTIRKTRGKDIDAACGQLKGRIQDRTRRSERFLISKPKGESTWTDNLAAQSFSG